MLEQSLDKGGEWITVSRFTANRDIINQLHSVELNERADALLVNVTLEEIKDTWQIAGELLQYWNNEQGTFQTAYSKVRLQEKSVIEIAPLASSTILFRPVEWLRGWTIEIRARLSPVSNRDLLNQAVININNNQELTVINNQINTIAQSL